MSDDRQLPMLFELFESLSIGVVVLDDAGKIVVYNQAEERLAGRKRDQVMGREFFVDVAPCLNVRELGQAFTAKVGRETIKVELDVSFPFPFHERPRDVHIKLNSFEVDGKAFGVLLLEDVSSARAVDRMKETLQSLLVHDLKNPLAIILANLGFVRGVAGVQADPDAVEAVADAVGSARRLQSMLLNLLDITRLESGALPLKPKDFELRELLTAISEASRGAAKARGGSIRVDLPEGANPFRGDPEMLRRALENLIDNAFRHSKNLVLRGGVTTGAQWIEVEDDGPGVPEAMREAIFEKFGEVAVNASSKSASNRGLGLTFVRLAARAHGGDVAVSCPPNRGSIFRLSLGAPRG